MDTNLLVSSFDKCGITSENKEDYHRQLRHFIDTNELTEDIDEDDGTSCFNGFYEEDKYRGVEGVNEEDIIDEDEEENGDESDNEDEDE